MNRTSRTFGVGTVVLGVALSYGSRSFSAPPAAPTPPPSHTPASTPPDTSAAPLRPAPPAPAPIFPCLDKLGKKGNPPLRLISPDSAPDKEETLVGELIGEAGKKKSFLTFENARKSVKLPEQGQIFSYGDGFVTGMYESTLKYVNFYRLFQLEKRHRKAEPENEAQRQSLAATKKEIGDKMNDLKASVLESLQKNDSVAEAWEGVKKDGLSREGALLAKNIDATVKMRANPARWEEAVRDLGKSASWAHSAAWVEVLRALAESYGDSAKAEKGRRALIHLDTFEELLRHPMDQKKDEAFFNRYVMENGIRPAATRIGKMYCDAFEKGQTLNVIVNDGYFKTLVNLLYNSAKGKDADEGDNLVQLRWQGKDLVIRRGGLFTK